MTRLWPRKFHHWSLINKLTVRYVATLTVVACTAIFGQLFVMHGLEQQRQDERLIRQTEKQFGAIKELNVATLTLQLSPDETQIQQSTATIRATSDNLSQSYLELARDIQQSEQATNVELRSILENLQKLHAKWGASQKALISITQPQSLTVSDPASNYDWTTLSQHLYEDVSAYKKQLENLVLYYEQAMTQRAQFINAAGYLGMGITLLFIFISGYYVFRPAVKRLGEALEVRAEFLSRISHEIKNPLNSVLGMSNLLRETLLTSQQRKYVDTMRSSAQYLLSMLNNALDFGSIEKGFITLEKIRFDLYELLAKTIDQTAFRAHLKNLDLILNVDLALPRWVDGDPVRLQEVLLNLVINAVKFTERGSVTLMVTRDSVNHPRRINFSVLDTGVGISKKDQKRIFESFVQADSSVRRRYGGTGLGLTIATELVRLMEGNLTVESEEGKGSHFYFSLPCDYKRHNVAISSMFDGHPLRGKKIVMLSNTPASFVLRGMVEAGEGIFIQLEGENRLDALLRAAGGDLQNFILVADSQTDRALTIKDLETAKQLTASTKQKPPIVCLLDTTARPEDVNELTSHGASHFFFKPLLIKDLLVSFDNMMTVEGRKPLALLQTNIPKARDWSDLNILVVDDSDENLFLIESYLRANNPRLTFKDRGLEALETFKSQNFDAVLMDIIMPDITGDLVVQAMRQWESENNLAPTPVIAVTAQENMRGTTTLSSSGFTSFLVKPFTRLDLQQAIESTLDMLRPGRLLAKSIPKGASGGLDTLAQVISKRAPVYLKNRRPDLEKLDQAVQGHDFEIIKEITHRLKGNAKTYGFEELGILARDMEKAALKEDTEVLRGLLNNMVDYVEAAEKRLDSPSV